MKPKTIFINVLLFLVACSLTSTNLGDNVLGFDGAEVDLPVIGATSLSIQQSPDCSIRPLPEDEGCKLKAQGDVIVFVSDINNPPVNPNTITSEIGIKAARIKFPTTKSPNDLPDEFTFLMLEAEFWAQDGVVSQRPANPDITINAAANESDLESLLFVKDSCANQICNYTVQGPKTILDIKINQASDFIDVFAEGSSQNTAGLIIESTIKDKIIPDNSILTIILTNPKTTAQLL